MFAAVARPRTGISLRRRHVQGKPRRRCLRPAFVNTPRVTG